MKWPKDFFKKQKWLSLAVGISFFLVELATLTDYGITWDSVNHYVRGQAYLHYFLTGSKTFENLPPRMDYYQPVDELWLPAAIKKQPRRSLYQIYDYQSLIDIRGGPSSSFEAGHPAFSDIMASGFNYLFFQKLGWINDIDAYHLYGIFLSAILVSVIFWWVRKNYCLLSAFVSVLSLTLYPLFFAESHFNVEKDIPQMVFFSLALLFFHQGITKKSWHWLIASSLMAGFSLATKLNFLFAVFIIFPWLVVYDGRFDKKIYLSLIFYWVLPLIIFIASWPYLWSDIFYRLKETASWYQSIGTNSVFDSRYLLWGKINTYAGQWILFITPLVTLLLGVAGFASAFKNKTTLLIVLWFLVPILRVSRANAGIYGGVRQIMEYIPALAILAGIGTYWLAKRIKTYQFIIKTIILLSFTPILLKIMAIHPNQNVYFNPLIGGLQGAKQRDFLDAGNTFGNVYRQGIAWVNENVPPGANLSFAYEMMSNIPSMWVRQDINFTNYHRSGFLRQGEYAIGLADKKALWNSHYGRYLETFLEPSFQIEVERIPILKVWENNEAHTRLEYLQEKKLADFDVSVEGDEIIIDLKRVVNLARLEAKLPERSCLPLEYGYFYLSLDGQLWTMLPEVLPTMWPIVVLKDQPANGKLIEPFAAETSRFIKIKLVPANTCLKQLYDVNIYEFSDLTK